LFEEEESEDEGGLADQVDRRGEQRDRIDIWIEVEFPEEMGEMIGCYQ
jgi:hypothetical protein